MLSPDPNGKPRVLIVDDDVISGRALARGFASRGHETRLVTSLGEAIAAVASDPPHLVVLDCNLNSRPALEMLRNWKQTAPELSVILVSASPSLTLAVDALREGAIGFCAKPATVGAILGELQHRSTAPPGAPLDLPSGHRLSADSLRANGVDRFFALSHGLLCVAGFDGYFKLLNRAWEATLGHTLDELCAVPYMEFIHPDDRLKASHDALQIREGEPVFYFRARFRCKNGSYKWLAWNASPVASQQVVYASAMDVTRVVAAEELRAQQLESSGERIEELLDLHRFKEEMSDLLVHDLRNPLSVILANHEFLAEEATLSADCKEALSDAQNATHRIQRLLANLVDVARFERSELEVSRTATDVGKLLDEVVTQRRSIAVARRLTIEARLDAIAPIEVDEDLLRRVVENVLDNALRYASPGGRVDLCLKEGADGIEVRIGNTGSAISPDRLASIFEKRRTVHGQPAQPGLGLGLHFCRLATVAQGGRIWVESTPELPCIFAFALPRVVPGRA